MGSSSRNNFVLLALTLHNIYTDIQYYNLPVVLSLKMTVPKVPLGSRIDYLL